MKQIRTTEYCYSIRRKDFAKNITEDFHITSHAILISRHKTTALSDTFMYSIPAQPLKIKNCDVSWFKFFVWMTRVYEVVQKDLSTYVHNTRVKIHICEVIPISKGETAESILMKYLL